MIHTFLMEHDPNSLGGKPCRLRNVLVFIALSDGLQNPRTDSRARSKVRSFGNQRNHVSYSIILCCITISMRFESHRHKCFASRIPLGTHSKNTFQHVLEHRFDRSAYGCGSLWLILMQVMYLGNPMMDGLEPARIDFKNYLRSLSSGGVCMVLLPGTRQPEVSPNFVYNSFFKTASFQFNDAVRLVSLRRAQFVLEMNFPTATDSSARSQSDKRKKIPKVWSQRREHVRRSIMRGSLPLQI